MICNFMFKEKVNQLIALESGGVASAVYYRLTGAGDRKTEEYKNNSLRRMC